MHHPKIYVYAEVNFNHKNSHTINHKNSHTIKAVILKNITNDGCYKDRDTANHSLSRIYAIRGGGDKSPVVAGHKSAAASAVNCVDNKFT
jgi:hypothetical protein